MKQILCLSAALCLLLTGCIGDITTPVTSPTTATTTVSITTATTTVTTETTTTTTTVETVDGSLGVVTTQPNNPDGFALTSEQIASLDTLIASYEGAVAVGYYDIISGYRYTYNGDQSFIAASVMKAPFCRYVLGMAEQNGLDLSSRTTTYTEDMLLSGTGIIKDAEFGTVYTHEELVKLAIRKSDNIAFKMLRQAYSVEGFKQYAQLIGITDIAGIKNVSSSNITAVDAITYMKDIYSYITGDTVHGKTLETHMLNTTYPLIRSQYPVIRKHGWMKGAYHDMAIIKAPRPYILVILSDHSKGSNEDRDMFQTISEAVEAVSGN